MFGHNDQDGQDNQSDQSSNYVADEVNSASHSNTDDSQNVVSASSQAVIQSGDQAWQHPGTPITTPQHHDDQASDTPSTTHHANDLIDIKQHALTELSPLVGHLDQTPEEKFRTTMMMIQASDDQSLVKTAYESAHAITDEKVRAQALLDIINEINYFTQNNDPKPN